jgi:benzoate 4-monooxygenase
MQNLPYLDACIKEGLRIHSTIAIDLPHVIPEGKFSAREDLRVIIFLGAGRLVVCGRFFFAGSVVGVPIYTLHREPDVWGNDPDLYRPERWFDVEKTTAMHKAFNPFSSGPRYVVWAIFTQPYDPNTVLVPVSGAISRPWSCRL